MSIKALTAGVFGAAMLASILAADAATLTPNGTVLVNSGNGFMQVTGPVEVAPGDMVMVNDGSAQMSFPDGSITPMQPGQVYTVGNIGTMPPLGGGGGLGGAAAGGAGAGMSTTTMLVGGAVVAGGAAAAIAASSSNKKSSSP